MNPGGSNVILFAPLMEIEASRLVEIVASMLTTGAFSI